MLVIVSFVQAGPALTNLCYVYVFGAALSAVAGLAASSTPLRPG